MNLRTSHEGVILEGGPWAKVHLLHVWRRCCTVMCCACFRCLLVICSQVEVSITCITTHAH